MSNKRKKYEKHPYSVRLQVVAKVLCEHLPLRTTGKMFDVNPRQVKYWVSLYSRYGEEGLRMQHRYYPVDFKYKVLQDVFENHLSLQEAALKYGIPSPSTVLMWQRKYKNVLKEIELLKAENAYLKKLRALVQERIARESKKGLPPSKN